MAFTITSRRVVCVAIICSHLLIAASDAGIVGNAKNDYEGRTPEERSLIPGFSGRTLLLKSLLLAPLGIGLVILAIMLLIPVPVIAAPAGRANEYNRAIHLAKKVITSDECVERISCELSRFTKNYETTSWIPRSIESYMKNSEWIGKVSRGFRAINSCRQFRCHPVNSMTK